jgi:hypothetical protein
MLRLLIEINGLFRAELLTEPATSIPEVQAFGFINGIEWRVIF